MNKNNIDSDILVPDTARVTVANELIRMQPSGMTAIQRRVFNYILYEGSDLSPDSTILAINAANVSKYFNLQSHKAYFQHAIDSLLKLPPVDLEMPAFRLDSFKENESFFKSFNISGSSEIRIKGSVFTNVIHSPDNPDVYFVEINRLFIPVIIAQRKNRSNYMLKNLSRLSGTGGALYTVLHTWAATCLKNKEPFAWKIDDRQSRKQAGIRQILNLENKYARPRDLRRNVLDKAVNEINAKTDLNITYKIVDGTAFFTFHEQASTDDYKSDEIASSKYAVAFRAFELINVLSHSNYRYSAKSNLKLITDILSAGYTPENIINTVTFRYADLDHFQKNLYRPNLFFNLKGESALFESFCQYRPEISDLIDFNDESSKNDLFYYDIVGACVYLGYTGDFFSWMRPINYALNNDRLSDQDLYEKMEAYYSRPLMKIDFTILSRLNQYGSNFIFALAEILSDHLSIFSTISLLAATFVLTQTQILEELNLNKNCNDLLGDIYLKADLFYSNNGIKSYLNLDSVYENAIDSALDNIKHNGLPSYDNFYYL